jgi:hypothetical protein
MSSPSFSSSGVAAIGGSTGKPMRSIRPQGTVLTTQRGSSKNWRVTLDNSSLRRGGVLAFLESIEFIRRPAWPVLPPGKHPARTRRRDEGDPSPASADDGGQLVLERAELECIVPLPGAGMVWLGGDQVAACHQFVAFDADVLAMWPSDFRRRFWCSTGQKQLTGFVLIARLVLL